MLSDDFAAVEMQMTKELIGIVGSLVQYFFSLNKDKVFAENNNIIDDKLPKGEVTQQELASTGDKICTITLDNGDNALNLEDPEVLGSLKKLLDASDVYYSIDKGENNSTILSFKESDTMFVKNCITSWEEDMRKKEAMEALYGKEATKVLDWDKINLLTPEQKESISKKWDKCFADMLDNDLSENDTVYEEAWKNCSFDKFTSPGQDGTEQITNIFESEEFIQAHKDGMSKREFFIQKVQESIGEKERNERFFMFEGRGAAWIDDKNVLHHLDFRVGKHLQTPCSSIDEAKEVFKNTNIALEKFQKDLDGKYSKEKGFNDAQRKFLYSCMLDSLTNKNVDITYFDHPNLSVDQMAALYKCQMDLSKDNAYVVLTRAETENLSKDEIWALTKFNEKQFPNLDISKVMDSKLSVQQLNALYDTLIDNGYPELSAEEDELLEYRIEYLVDKSYFIETDNPDMVVVNVPAVDDKISSITKKLGESYAELQMNEIEIRQANTVLAGNMNEQKREILNNYVSYLENHKEEIMSHIKDLVSERKELFLLKKDYQTYKNMIQQKTEIIPLEKSIAIAVDKQINQEKLVDSMLQGEKTKVEQKLSLKEAIYKADIEMAQAFKKEVPALVDNVLNNAETMNYALSQPSITIQGEAYKELISGEQFTYYLDGEQCLMVQMKGTPLEPTEQLNQDWKKSKISFKDSNGNEYRLISKNKMGQIYADKNGKTLIQLEQKFNKNEIMKIKTNQEFELNKKITGPNRNPDLTK